MGVVQCRVCWSTIDLEKDQYSLAKIHGIRHFFCWKCTGAKSYHYIVDKEEQYGL